LLPLGGENNSTKAPGLEGHTTGIMRSMPLSPKVGYLHSTTTGTSSHLYMTIANSTSLVMGNSSDDRNNPSATSVCVPVPDHSLKAGFVVGMILVVIVAAAIRPW